MILGLETSCDETAAALITEAGDIRANVVASQAELYVRLGALPDRTTFDLSTLGNLASISPELVLTNALGGDYYILVHGAGVGAAAPARAGRPPARARRLALPPAARD